MRTRRGGGGVACVAFIAMLIAACGGSTPGSTVSPPVSACGAAFDAAAAVDPMQDSVSDLYPAIRACSLADWRTEFAAHDGAGFTGTADEVLRNACSADAVASTALCTQVE